MFVASTNFTCDQTLQLLGDTEMIETSTATGTKDEDERMFE